MSGSFYLFFFNETATTEIYTYLHTLSLHDALPISARQDRHRQHHAHRQSAQPRKAAARWDRAGNSWEHSRAHAGLAKWHGIANRTAVPRRLSAAYRQFWSWCNEAGPRTATRKSRPGPDRKSIV